MHGGRMPGGAESGGPCDVKIKGADKEHEQHEMLVKHFKVNICP